MPAPGFAARKSARAVTGFGIGADDCGVGSPSCACDAERIDALERMAVEREKRRIAGSRM
jgi:hypothetical protein